MMLFVPSEAKCSEQLLVYGSKDLFRISLFFDLLGDGAGPLVQQRVVTLQVGVWIPRAGQQTCRLLQIKVLSAAEAEFEETLIVNGPVQLLNDLQCAAPQH